MDFIHLLLIKKFFLIIKYFCTFVIDWKDFMLFLTELCNYRIFCDRCFNNNQKNEPL